MKFPTHYTDGLPVNIIKRKTIRDFLRNDSIHNTQIKFYQRSLIENRVLQDLKYVIGRTEFDYAITSLINPNIRYYHCDEILREAFYNQKWDISNCRKRSIFVSQSNYPIKGFHIMLKALRCIIKRFPDAVLYTTGDDPRNTNIRSIIKQNSYQRYVVSLIKKYGLSSNVVFLGTLSETEMCDQYLKSNVFVLSSTIENSPNSLGEAMMLGVPSISSDVGGVKDFITHNNDGFIYQCEAYYMLAYYIMKIFEDDNLANKFSVNAMEKAHKMYDREKIKCDVLNIYNDISKGVSNYV